jgi:hypothetical protein
MTHAIGKASTYYKTFIVQASLTIVTYDRQNIFIVQWLVPYKYDDHK